MLNFLMSYTNFLHIGQVLRLPNGSNRQRPSLSFENVRQFFGDGRRTFACAYPGVEAIPFTHVVVGIVREIREHSREIIFQFVGDSLVRIILDANRTNLHLYCISGSVNPTANYSAITHDTFIPSSRHTYVMNAFVDLVHLSTTTYITVSGVTLRDIVQALDDTIFSRTGQHDAGCTRLLAVFSDDSANRDQAPDS